MSGLKRLLAINFGGIGDEILFLPTLNTIKQVYSECHITLLVEPRSKSIEQVTNLIDRTVAFDIKKRPLLLADIVVLAAMLRDGGYDAVISSGSSPLVSVMLWLSGIECKVGYNSGWLSRLLLTAPVALRRDQYAAAMYHDLVQGLAIKSQLSLPEVIVPQESRQLMADFLRKHGLGTTYSANSASVEFAERAASQPRRSAKIVIHPGTSRLAVDKGIIKTWPAECWADLITNLAVIKDLAVILAGGPDDEDTVVDILRLVQPGCCVSAFGQTTNLADLAALIDLCDVLVSVDSAAMHIGIGLKKPLVALFGPTDPDRLLPSDPRFKILRHPSGDQQVAGVHLEPGVVLEAVLAQVPLK